MIQAMTKMLLLILGLTTEAEEPCVLTDAMSETCLTKLESALLTSRKEAITKVGNVIEVHARNGKVIRFEGNPEGDNYDDYSTYNAVALIEPGQFVVIIQWRYEGREVHFVSLLDGASYKVDGMPIVSPDGKYLLVHSMDIDANYDANFIALYRIENATLKREYFISGDEGVTESWGPNQIKWLSPTLIRFSKVSHATIGSGYASEQWQLELKDGAWTSGPCSTACRRK